MKLKFILLCDALVTQATVAQAPRYSNLSCLKTLFLVLGVKF